MWNIKDFFLFGFIISFLEYPDLFDKDYLIFLNKNKIQLVFYQKNNLFIRCLKFILMILIY